MKRAILCLLTYSTLCANAYDLCGARVPEREEENHQIQNTEIVDAPPPQEPQGPRVDEKVEWKPDPRIEGYEYYDKPNGVRVYRVKPCAMMYHNPQVLNPEFL